MTPTTNMKNNRVEMIAKGYFFKTSGKSLTASEQSQQRIKIILPRVMPAVES